MTNFQNTFRSETLEKHLETLRESAACQEFFTNYVDYLLSTDGWKEVPNLQNAAKKIIELKLSRHSRPLWDGVLGQGEAR